MTNFLDIKMLIFTIIIIEVFLATIMMIYIKRQKGYPGFTLWALHLVFLIIHEQYDIQGYYSSNTIGPSDKCI
jgi:uncharacterized membrane protein